MISEPTSIFPLSAGPSQRLGPWTFSMKGRHPIIPTAGISTCKEIAIIINMIQNSRRAHIALSYSSTLTCLTEVVSKKPQIINKVYTVVPGN